MQLSPSKTQVLPDAAAELVDRRHGRLDWVGMHGIALPVQLDAAGGVLQVLPARVDAEVSLSDPNARGIHMSRLYLACERVLGNQPLNGASLHLLLDEFLESHAGLSDAARVQVRFELLLRRPALLSELSGWRAYPSWWRATHTPAGRSLQLGFTVLYSSTCPASAALSRQLVQHAFVEKFGATGPVDSAAVQSWLSTEAGMAATPHSQRSVLEVELELDPSAAERPLQYWIDQAEAALLTPVQTAVRRIDEQEFARRNAQNLMFCEDAARRVRAALHGETGISEYHIRVAHLESLHAHDAIVSVRGRPG